MPARVKVNKVVTNFILANEVCVLRSPDMMRKPNRVTPSTLFGVVDVNGMTSLD